MSSTLQSFIRIRNTVNGEPTKLINLQAPLSNSGVRFFNHQRHVTSFRIHSIHPAFVNIRCRYALDE